LPEWAKRTFYSPDPHARTHALLVHLLPSNMLRLLPTPYTDRIQLLQALSSGQLLCVAYNAGVRRSRKPWGYINKDAIHDIAALEEGADAISAGSTETAEAAEKRKTGWTFRRTDNLRLWAGALKIRYLLPLTTPPVPSSQKKSIASDEAETIRSASPITPTQTKASSAEPPIVFDGKIIARKDDGWLEMLETVVLRWVSAVAQEKRGER